MKLPHRSLATGLLALMLLNYTAPVRACGPWPTEPIFVFHESPDLPFTDFTSGKVGIVRPSLGRKTLVIAYRYLNGGSFNAEEQLALVDALNGKAAETDSPDPVKAWIKARKELFGEDQPLPQLYTERQYGGYDFFPNCTQNAFEVATETMRDRVATYGAGDPNVKLWLDAQDTVFENCNSGSHIPPALGDGSATWLRKDRDYQIAAAHFYSLHFAEARQRFAQIAYDVDSPWREVAPYLIGRTLVREASLTADETNKRELFTQAETHLQMLISSGGKFAGSSQKLLALVKYHLRPEERVVELGNVLASGSDDNLRQDLIDYVWLLDKLEARILKEEADRKDRLNAPAKIEQPAPSPENTRSPSGIAYDKLERGELISVSVQFAKPDGTTDSTSFFSSLFQPDAPETEIIAAVEQKLNRKLTPEETKQVQEAHQAGLNDRQWKLSPNRKWGVDGMSQHESRAYDSLQLTFDLVPEFFRATDLTDWIVTLQMPDANAYSHAFARWRETSSNAWLISALTKANKTSPHLAQLLRATEKITRDDPAFPTVAYHVVRLEAAAGQTNEARRLVDAILSASAETLPISARNLFLEQRMSLARDVTEFLQSAPRTPIAFYNEYGLGTLAELKEKQKHTWFDPPDEKDEELDRLLDRDYEPLLPWQDRLAFDNNTTDIFNWHIPLQVLTEAARNRDLPEYLQRSLVLAAWTRAIVLNKDDVAQSIAPEVLRVAPEMSEVFNAYLRSRTAKQRQNAALYVLLKFPNLSPFVVGGLPLFSTTEELEYELESGWWCPLSTTDYDERGNELPKVVPQPTFLTAAQLETAARERSVLQAIGDAKSYLGKQVIQWAKASPLDPRVPEALFIAVRANESYKYGCEGWDHDEETKDAAEKLLRDRYAHSPWTAKLGEIADQ